MSNPIIAWNNLLKGVTTTGSLVFADREGEWELTRPAANLPQPWLAKRAESKNKTIQIITGQNDMLDFRYNTGAGLTVGAITVEGGTYRPKALASKVKSKLNAIVADGFNAQYDNTTKKYTLAADGVIVTQFQLYHLDGVNRSQSIAKTLGYDVSANSAVGLTFEADYVRTSSWGIMAIAAGVNDHLVVGGPLTVDVDDANFNIFSFCTRLIWNIADQKGWLDVDVDWDESTHKFRIKKKSGTATFSFAAGGTTLKMGFNSNFTTVADTYTDADDVFIHTEAAAQFGNYPPQSGLVDSLTAADPSNVPYFFALRNTNLEATATVTLQYFGALTWHDILTTNPDASGNVMEFFVRPQFSDTPIRIVITDQKNPSGFIYIGIAFIGRYFELDRAPMWRDNPVEFWSQDYSTISQADYGQVSATVKPRDSGITMSFEAATPVDRGNWEALQDELSVGPGFFLMLDADNYLSELTYYVRLVERISFKDTGTTTVSPVNAGFNNYDYTVSVVESK